jgi:hypothetical protein
MDADKSVNQSFEKNGKGPLSIIPLPNEGNIRLWNDEDNDGETKILELTGTRTNEISCFRHGIN